MSKVDEARLLRPLVEKAVATAEFTEEETELVTNLFPLFEVGKSYAVGDKVRYEGILYKCLQAHTSQADWSPENAPSLWAKVLTDPNGGILDWVQPDSTNPYMTGDRVRFNGKVYESLIDNNVWSPADYPQGWKEIE